MTVDDEILELAISRSDLDEDDTISEYMRIVDDVCEVHGCRLTQENGPMLAGAKLALITLEYVQRAHKERLKRKLQELAESLEAIGDKPDDEELN